MSRSTWKKLRPASRPLALALLFSTGSSVLAGGASAAVISSTTPMSFGDGSVSIGYGASKHFTFSDNGSFLPSPVSIETSGGAAVTAFGLPFYDPSQPTTYFDPAVSGGAAVPFDSSNNYVSFATAIAIPYSASTFVIGLADEAPDGIHYGYGRFYGTTLVAYGFESVAGLGILSPVPLPASAPVFSAALLALGVVGYGMKRKAKAAA